MLLLSLFGQIQNSQTKIFCLMRNSMHTWEWFFWSPYSTFERLWTRLIAVQQNVSVPGGQSISNCVPQRWKGQGWWGTGWGTGREESLRVSIYYFNKRCCFYVREIEREITTNAPCFKLFPPSSCIISVKGSLTFCWQWTCLERIWPKCPKRQKFGAGRKPQRGSGPLLFFFIRDKSKTERLKYLFKDSD